MAILDDFTDVPDSFRADEECDDDQQNEHHGNIQNHEFTLNSDDFAMNAENTASDQGDREGKLLATFSYFFFV